VIPGPKVSSMGPRGFWIAVVVFLCSTTWPNQGDAQVDPQRAGIFSIRLESDRPAYKVGDPIRVEANDPQQYG